MWINHPRKKEPDAALTLSVYAFAACLLKFLGNGVTVGDFSFGTVDASLIAALLGPTLIAYTARKYTDSPDKKEV